MKSSFRRLVFDPFVGRRLFWLVSDPHLTPWKQVDALSRVLREHGVKTGDRVLIYMPMAPEAIFGMLAVRRSGVSSVS
jgi:AMP-binding enzyme